jgi:predicted nucleotidyltransferase component of viral defense system
MIGDILDARLHEYNPSDAVEQENVLQELLQNFILAGLSRAGFFKEAIFHGGTCLRILYGTRRYSEDLDFILLKGDPNFTWEPYLEEVRKECLHEGIVFEIVDKSKAETAVRKAFFKTDSIGKVILLDLPFERSGTKKIRIKVEIDTNPPEGSGFETRYLTFPVISPITVQTPASGFALKAHALLCRPYVKGRDWYDFVWYTTGRIKPDLPLLKNALLQQGPWAGRHIDVTPAWFLGALDARIREIDWAAARADVERFVPPSDRRGLDFWGTEFFLDRLRVMREYV